MGFDENQGTSMNDNVPNLREIQKKCGDIWMTVRMNELSKGDLFRLRNSRKEPWSYWTADEDPYDDNGTWAINASPAKE